MSRDFHDVPPARHKVKHPSALGRPPHLAVHLSRVIPDGDVYRIGGNLWVGVRDPDAPRDLSDPADFAAELAYRGALARWQVRKAYQAAGYLPRTIRVGPEPTGSRGADLLARLRGDDW